jgi:hypothetical protein
MGFVSGTQNTLIKELDYLWVDEKKKKKKDSERVTIQA